MQLKHARMRILAPAAAALAAVVLVKANVTANAGVGRI